MSSNSTTNRYDKYKDSCIEWIGEIPESWILIKAKYLFLQSLNKGGEALILLSATQNDGVIPKDRLEGVVQVKEDADLNAFKSVKKGDFVISLRSFQGGFEYSNYDGVITPAYTVFRKKEIICNNYFKKLFKSDGFIAKINSLTTGIRDGKNIQYEDFADMFLPLPALDLQQQIADYLDKKCGEIDEIVDKQKAVIEKLKEYKQSIITEAVTKGLDKSVPLKDSGIEWIGKIPEHWEIKRIKYTANYFEKGNGITKEDVVLDGDIQCIRYGEIYSKYDKQCVDCVTSTNLNKISSPKHISRGDILFAGTGELIEEIGKNIVYIGDKPCLAGGDIIILNHNQNPIFLNYALNSAYAQSQKSCGKVKLKVVHISASAIGDIRIVIPPIEEQARIADYLDKKYMEIDKIITDKKQVIEKLEEYKKSLIYECVTGKRKVFS